MQRFLLVVVAFCLLPSLALARTWTNREGKEIIADFVDATEEKLTLKMSTGKVVTFGLEKLCDDDQSFVRGILARRVGKKPAASTDEPGSPFESVDTPAKPPSDLKTVARAEKVEGLGTMRDVDETKKKLKPENREWTDVFGNKSAGKFIRLQGNNVLVLRSGRQVTLDYWQLSDTDRDYLKELGEANGWSNLIPKINPAERRNNGPGANIAGNPGFNSGPAPGAFNSPPPGAFAGAVPGVSQPASVSPPSIPSGLGNPEDLAKRLRELEEQNRSTTTIAPPSSTIPANPTYPQAGPSYTPPTSPSSGYGGVPGSSNPYSGVPSSPPPGAYPTTGSTMPSSIPGSSSMSGPSSMPSMSGPSSIPGSSFPNPTFPDPTFGGPTMTMEKQCENCGKVLPASFTAGDTCPGCGVYFSHDDTNGKTANPGIFGGGGGGGGGGPSRGVIRGIIVLVVLGIKGFAYMVWRSQQGSS